MRSSEAAAFAGDCRRALGKEKMLIRIFLSVSLISLTLIDSSSSAPAAAASTGADEINNEKLLIRTKRSEEVVYGNHQNEPREKKSVISDDERTDDTSKTDDVKSTQQKLAQDLKLDESAEQNDQAGNIGKYNVDRRKRNAQVHMERTSSDTMRRKRSTHLAPMMTAENMANGFTRRSKQMRTKRDLDYEQLREILEGSENSNQYDQDDSDATEENVDENLIAAEDEREREYENEKLQVEEELAREILELKAEKDKREQLLGYLIKSDEEVRIPSPNDDEVYEIGSDRIPEAEGEYYIDRPRDDLVPALLKRRGEFYPYSYEPYGGRWGAVVPGSKRSPANSYERLYRLAEALNDDYDENEISEKK